MIKLFSSTLIERPIKQVFDFVSTPENDFKWQYGTLATASLPKTTGTLRTFFRSIGHLMGRRNLSTFEVTEYEPHKKYGFKSLTGPVHSTTSYILENVNGWTRIRISIQASAPNFFKVTKKYGFKSLTGPVHSTTSYILENVNGWTRICISIQASAPNFFKVTERLLEKTMKKQFEEDISRLKAILEENATVFQVQQDSVYK